MGIFKFFLTKFCIVLRVSEIIFRIFLRKFLFAGNPTWNPFLTLQGMFQLRLNLKQSGVKPFSEKKEKKEKCFRANLLNKFPNRLKSPTLAFNL